MPLFTKTFFAYKRNSVLTTGANALQTGAEGSSSEKLNSVLCTLYDKKDIDMTVYSETSEGRRRFVLDAKLCGRRRRQYFSTEKEANRAYQALKSEIKAQGALFARYPEATRIEWMAAHELAKSGGFTVMDAVRHYADMSGKEAEANAMTVGEAVRAFLREKKTIIKPRSYRSLSSTLERFAEPRWNAPLASETRAIVMDWLTTGTKAGGEPWSTRTRNGYLIDVKNFFNWCVFEGHLTVSPAGRIRKFRASDEEMIRKEEAKKILTTDEVSRLMAYLRDEEPDMVPRAALLFFAGLRPEREASNITFDDVLMSEGLVHVRGSSAKDRQSRFITMSDNLVEWLEWSMDNGHQLPVGNWDRRWNEARGNLGLTGDDWPHDATRHSFASYHLALHGEDSTRKALGHGNFDMLFQHYRTLVKPADAERYYNICTDC